MTDDAPLHRLSAFVDLTVHERAALRDIVGPGSSFDTAECIRSEGDEASCLFLLHEGWVLSGITHPDGSRQVLKIHRSGDIMGAPSLPFEAAVESLVALTPVKIGTIPYKGLGALFKLHPRLAGVMFLNCQEERVTLMDRLAISGRLSAKHSVVSLLLLLFEGRPPSESSDAKLYIPLTQSLIADALGLSTVHINRVVRALEADGLIKREGYGGHVYELPDVPRLRRFVGMPERVRRRDPSWLPPAAP